MIPCPSCAAGSSGGSTTSPGPFTDTHDRQWVFVEKSAVVSEAHLSSGSRYPVDAGILCDTLNGDAEDTPGTVRISLSPWGPASVEGHTEFDVRPGQLSATAVSAAPPSP
ncbi:hypothetical protein [Streptomyces sp. BoleA5]|uniref:hypothetical protein n=1 Tax=Streptomyces sp. BoleA5 TaxID=1157637 RepID=UPI00039B3507|nr:hypothetical protein [Streptomyces sp. BoleA5]MYX38006.1 hypothetical protein [Streptomyces sp. SID8377]